MDELDLDTLLAAIGNPTRRRILRELVKETHYPLQLSRELSVSQQAIIKHLKVLEDSDLVTCVYKDSDTGPPRKCYAATKRLTLVIDLSPEMFNEELRFHEDENVIQADSTTRALRNVENMRVRLTEFMTHIWELNSQLEQMARERDRLVSAKENAMRYANNIIDILCEDYDERKVLRYLVSEYDFDIQTMSEKLDMRESEIEDVMRRLERKGLLMVSR